MATHKSAEKRHRQSEKRRERNKHWRTTVRTAVRRARAAALEKAPEAGESVKQAETLLRRAVTKGIVHRRTVDRTVSRLHKLLPES
jgi:small subunit ribosomal protein S20